ncbi:MAG TPA: hypothetical protein VF487_20550 [Chitinophagaceae bacterium]
MKSILSERNIVVVLFVMVLITFSLAQEDSKKIEKLYLGTSSVSVTTTPGRLVKNEISQKEEKNDAILPAAYKE